MLKPPILYTGLCDSPSNEREYKVMPPKLHKSPEKTFDYNDVILVPAECVVSSRSEVDTSVKFGPRTFKLPIVPANMSTVVDEKTCEWLAAEGYFYVMHRFDVDAVEFTKVLQSKGLFASVSFGIKEADYRTIERFVAEGVTPDYITVDVAHGDSLAVFKIVRELKKQLPGAFVIAGNIATPDAAKRLVEVGVDAVKVGVGPGSACLTAPNTGFGSRFWHLSAVADVAEALEDSPVQIIADGGIRLYGDFAKSVAFGADMIMVGGFFAGHDESPGEIIDDNGQKVKEFFGSASEYQKGEAKNVEGKRMLVPYKGPLSVTLQTVKENLQSSVSYAGGRELFDLRNTSYVLLNK